jgi:putative pyruvate formate lyase activating enzyme
MDSTALRKEMEHLISQGAENIDLVTPTQYLPTILQALEQPLPVPVIYNCGGYERTETLGALQGKIDIYLPDMKYADNSLAQSLSGAKDYFEVAGNAVKEMARQVGKPEFDGNLLKKGVIVRHLILPGQVENSLKVLDFLGENFAPGEILVSLMRQYTPMPGLQPPYNRPITDAEYESVLSWMYLNNLQGLTQEQTAASENFIPDF